MFPLRFLIRAAVVVLLMGGAASIRATVLSPSNGGDDAAYHNVVQEDTGQALVAALGCAACHAGVLATTETVRVRTPSLSDAGRRYPPEYLFEYLQQPQRIRQNLGATRMPSFGLSERESLALTLYLQSLEGSAPAGASGPDDFTRHFESKTRDEQRTLDRAYRRVRRANDDVTAASGEVLFVAFNCAGCHQTQNIQPAVVGPDLSNVTRLQGDWLADYLLSPVPIRPFGFHPGAGARMPNFALSDEEGRLLTDHLRSQGRESNAQFAGGALSAFSQDKALRLVRDRLPCLGCHRLNGEGGRIGPDLSNVGRRLTAQSVHDMLTNPQREVPGSIMPQHPMPEERTLLLTSFLMSQTAGATDSYASPLDFAVVRPTTTNDGAALYGRFCSACHGINGDGGGFNATFLPVMPTAHDDSAHMSDRPDDTLFDGVHAGAYILGKSHRMPAFGQRLTSDEIRSVVSHMRELCRCEGPSWSRDGRGR